MVRVTERRDMTGIYARVKERRQDYISYDFTRIKNDILKTFFDLTQEYETIENLYRICVAVPYEFMKVESRLYLLGDESGELVLVCDSQEGLFASPRPAPAHISLSSTPYEKEGSFVVPIVRRQYKDREFAVLKMSTPAMGMFEIYPVDLLSDDDRFFFTKYTNRIGYNIYSRLLDRQNIRHLRFINTLILDIEHNVIVPNMYFRYLFRQLRKKIQEMAELEAKVRGLVGAGDKSPEACQQVQADIACIQKQLDEYLLEVEKHHSNQSLFLESLFRRDHFEKGHLVLRTKSCMVDREIITPQIDRYRQQLTVRNITIEHPMDMAGEEFPLVVDVGLLAQVYANLISNAVKYTETITRPDGTTNKALAYGREYLPDCFGPGKDGVKFNVFTTGQHIPEEERSIIFDSGVRCEKDAGLPGTGHGLAFIKNVIEIHAGRVGYEPTSEGNNFYFILPLAPKKTLEGIPLEHELRGNG